MKVRWLMSLLLLVAGTAHGVTIGFLPAGGGTTFSVGASPLTVVSSSYPALEGGTVNTASVIWVQVPISGCANAFRIKFLRPNTAGLPFALTVMADRGPFNAAPGLNVVTLSPPVTVQDRDMIAVTQLRPHGECGGVANAKVDQTSTFFIAPIDPTTGSPVGNLTFSNGYVPSVRASTEATVVHGYIPVVGSLTGTFGSRFKTGLQLTNRSVAPAVGKLVFHPAGAPASSSDPALNFVINGFNDTVSIDDAVAAMGRSGLGSMDVVVTNGPAPDITVRIYDDQGVGGTAGFTTEVLTASQALYPLAAGTLTTPSDLTNFRLNIGVRTLGQGANLEFFIFDSNGGFVAGPVTRSYPANYFEQNAASVFLDGAAIPEDGLISVFVQSGSAFVYGATTDNRTNDARVRLFVSQ